MQYIYRTQYTAIIRFKMSISPLKLCVYGGIFHEVTISLHLFKQQINNYVQ